MTGVSGMVGGNFLKHPDSRDYEILAPMRTHLDLLNYSAVEEYLERNRPDMIIHAAGKVGGIQANLSEPSSFLVENLDMGRNIVWASRKVGVKRLINLGSSCMYPRNQVAPLREELVLKGELEPTNEAYSLAKIMTMRLCEYIMREDSSFRYKTLIPCNLYGPRDSFNPTRSHLIPAIIKKLHEAKRDGMASVEVWGNGNARREFMYVGDFTDALMKAIKTFDALPLVMNIGCGYDYTIDEFYRIAAEVIGYSGSFTHNTSKPVGMQRKLVNIERQKAWGWTPKTDLRLGLRKTYEYYLMSFAQ